MAEELVQGVAPEAAIHAVRVGRLTALRKPDGVLVNHGPADERCSEAGSTRAGCECISRALQGLTELDHVATVLSIDGIGGFDLISRGAMLQGLRDVSPAALPGSSMALRLVFCGRMIKVRSALNVPLLLSAEEQDIDNPVVRWLVEESQCVPTVIVAGVQMSGFHAAVTGWESLRDVLHSRGIRSREGLAEWIHS